jgi:hypothetical protein
MGEIYVGDRVLVSATVREVIPGVGVRVELFSKTDQYDAWVRERDVTVAAEGCLPDEPTDGAWLRGGGGNTSGPGLVFHRDDRRSPTGEGRRYDRHWWDFEASEWVDWPEAVGRGADPSNRLIPELAQ